MREQIKEMERSYITKGIISDLQTSVTEKEHHTFLGSTDRKAYTLRICCLWLDEKFEAYVDVQPFEQREVVQERIEKLKNMVRHDAADSIYKKYFSSTKHNDTN